jgi:hypothetical protein
MHQMRISTTQVSSVMIRSKHIYNFRKTNVSSFQIHLYKKEVNFNLFCRFQCWRRVYCLFVFFSFSFFLHQKKKVNADLFFSYNFRILHFHFKYISWTLTWKEWYFSFNFFGIKMQFHIGFQAGHKSNSPPSMLSLLSVRTHGVTICCIPR